MKKFTLAFSTLLVSIAFVSCSKEAEQPTAKTDITGTWKFISLAGKTNTTMQVSDGTEVVKTITTSDYVSQKNTGTLNFEEAKMSANNLSYYINTIAHATFYHNGTSENISSPFEFTIPAYNATTTYKRIGEDSIYFDSGSMFMDGMTTQSKAGGAKFRIENDKMYLVHLINESTTEKEEGVTSASTVQAAMTITLQKQ